MPEIPDGWLDYSSFGKPIKDTCIIAIKTPLKKGYSNGRPKKDSPPYVRGRLYRGGVPLEEEFTPSQLVDRLRKRHERKLYAVIDLTFTFRYYNSKELTDLGVKYAKVKCPGKEIPSDEVYKKFSDVLTTFISGCDKDSLVAVHCTHGLNRTGYLISRYLVEKKVFDIETAIREFGVARGYEIERENYLKHLRDGCPPSRNKLLDSEHCCSHSVSCYKSSHSLCYPPIHYEVGHSEFRNISKNGFYTESSQHSFMQHPSFKEQKAAIYMKMVPTGIILKIIIHMNVSQKETFPLTILTMQEMNMQGLLELIFRLTIEIYYRECHAIFQLIVLLPLHQLNMLKTASIAETN